MAFKGNIWDWVRGIVLVISAVLWAYTGVSSFFDLPQISNSEAARFVAVTMFMIAALWKIVELERRLAGVNTRIRLTDKIIPTSPGSDAENVCVVVDNQEGIEITNFYATVEEAVCLDGSDGFPITKIEKKRLQWQNVNSNNDCEATMPAEYDQAACIIGQTGVGFRFTICHWDQFVGYNEPGVYLVHIRLDGKINGKNIRPRKHTSKFRVMHVEGEQVLKLALVKRKRHERYIRRTEAQE